jgi:hypothetical protein
VRHLRVAGSIRVSRACRESDKFGTAVDLHSHVQCFIDRTFTLSQTFLKIPSGERGCLRKVLTAWQSAAAPRKLQPPQITDILISITLLMYAIAEKSYKSRLSLRQHRRNVYYQITSRQKAKSATKEDGVRCMTDDPRTLANRCMCRFYGNISGDSPLSVAVSQVFDKYRSRYPHSPSYRPSNRSLFQVKTKKTPSQSKTPCATSTT